MYENHLIKQLAILHNRYYKSTIYLYYITIHKILIKGTTQSIIYKTTLVHCKLKNIKKSQTYTVIAAESNIKLLHIHVHDVHKIYNLLKNFTNSVI